MFHSAPTFEYNLQTMACLAEHLLVQPRKDKKIILSHPIILENFEPSQLHQIFQEQWQLACRRQIEDQAHQFVFLYQIQNVWFALTLNFDAHRMLMNALYLHPTQPLPPEFLLAWQKSLPSLMQEKIQSLPATVAIEALHQNNGAWLLEILRLNLHTKKIMVVPIVFPKTRTTHEELLKREAPMIPLSELPIDLILELEKSAHLNPELMGPDLNQPSILQIGKRQLAQTKRLTAHTEKLFHSASKDYSEARYSEAEIGFKKVLALRERIEGKESPNIASALDNVGATYYGRGHYQEAEVLYQRSLSIREKIYGKAHHALAISYDNLGAVYQSQGRHDEAEIAHQTALKLFEKFFGKAHPKSQMSLDNLADVYHAQGCAQETQGHSPEAAAHHKKALEIREKIHGKEHLSVANSLLHLGLAYSEQGVYREAEAAFQKALAIFTKTSHFADIAIIHNNLGSVYQSQGRYAEAEAAHQTALAIREKTSETSPLELASSYNNLGTLYHAQSRYQEAESAHQKALAIKRQSQGEEHHTVATSYSNLGVTYFSQGRYAEAEAAHQKALAIREKIYGAEHADVAACYGNLSLICESQDRYPEAEALSQKALTLFEKIYGATHPNVAKCLHNLAGICQSQHRYQEAEALYTRSISTYEKTLGTFAVSTCESKLRMARLYEKIAIQNPPEGTLKLQQAIQWLEKIYTEHQTFFAKKSSQIHSIYDLGDYDLLLKALTRLYRYEGKRVQIIQLYLKEAKCWRGKFQSLSLRYVLKAERELPFLSIQNTGAYSHEIQALKLEVQHHPKASWGDPDLMSQWQCCLLNRRDIELRLFKDLSRGHTLSETIKNQIADLIIKLRNLLDQSMVRFVRDCIDNPNEYLRRGALYFIFADSLAALERKWLKAKLNGNPRINLKSPALQKAHLVLQKHQPFNSATNWLTHITAIGIENKHVRLSPQSYEDKLAKEEGLIRDRHLKIMIEGSKIDRLTQQKIKFTEDLSSLLENAFAGVQEIIFTLEDVRAGLINKTAALSPSVIPPAPPHSPFSFKTLEDSQAAWQALEMKVQTHLAQNHIVKAIELYQAVLARPDFPIWLQGVVYQRCSWLAGNSLETTLERQALLQARADYFYRQDLLGQRQKFLKKSGALASPFLHPSPTTQLAEQPTIAPYLGAQLEYVKERLQRLPHQIWEATFPKNLSLQMSVENTLAELLIKTHHLLENTVVHFFECNPQLPRPPQYRNKQYLSDILKTRVLPHCPCAAPEITNSEQWLPELEKLSNTSKHERLLLLDWIALSPGLLLSLFEERCLLQNAKTPILIFLRTVLQDIKNLIQVLN